MNLRWSKIWYKSRLLVGMSVTCSLHWHVWSPLHSVHLWPLHLTFVCLAEGPSSMPYFVTVEHVICVFIIVLFLYLSLGRVLLSTYPDTGLGQTICYSCNWSEALCCNQPAAAVGGHGFISGDVNLLHGLSMQHIIIDIMKCMTFTIDF